MGLCDVAKRSLRIGTPIGYDLVVETDGATIVASNFMRRVRAANDEPHPLLLEARRQVEAYFARKLARFELPLALRGTPLQCAIWHFVATLPYGEVISYADVGRALGHPRAHRAVAMAMGQSPYDLFIPAHRVIGADGRIKGANAGSIRRRLLVFEGMLSSVRDDAIRSWAPDPHCDRPLRRSR